MLNRPRRSTYYDELPYIFVQHALQMATDTAVDMQLDNHLQSVWDSYQKTLSQVPLNLYGFMSGRYLFIVTMNIQVPEYIQH